MILNPLTQKLSGSWVAAKVNYAKILKTILKFDNITTQIKHT